MTEQLYRIHWKANKTGNRGTGGAFPKSEATGYVNALNESAQKIGIDITHWIEPVNDDKTTAPDTAQGE